MPVPELSILIVDDAKFSSAVVRRTLSSAGYQDIRNENSATEALKSLEQRPADIIIADWLMPEMDGLELTSRVRQQDEAINRYTYVVLLTAREGAGALQEAFEQGVDDFINKSFMNEQLLHRVYAGERLVLMQNRLLNDNQRLLDAYARLKKQSIIDPLTGYGNRQYGIRRLEDALRHTRSRGGAACLLLMRIDNLHDLENKPGSGLAKQVLLAFSRRLKQLVRPMDILARMGPDLFCVITHQPDMGRCSPGSFRRLQEGLNHRAYKTGAGFIRLEVSISLCAAGEGDETGAEQMVARASEGLGRSREMGRIAEQALFASDETAAPRT
jgi:sigma-B regulation protein RsbU (phosphoserine phosphatase)